MTKCVLLLLFSSPPLPCCSQFDFVDCNMFRIQWTFSRSLLSLRYYLPVFLCSRTTRCFLLMLWMRQIKELYPTLLFLKLCLSSYSGVTSFFWSRKDQKGKCLSVVTHVLELLEEFKQKFILCQETSTLLVTQFCHHAWGNSIISANSEGINTNTVNVIIDETLKGLEETQNCFKEFRVISKLLRHSIFAWVVRHTVIT